MTTISNVESYVPYSMYGMFQLSFRLKETWPADSRAASIKTPQSMAAAINGRSVWASCLWRGWLAAFDSMPLGKPSGPLHNLEHPLAQRPQVLALKTSNNNIF